MTMTVECVPTLINNTWTLNLPPHRAARPEWADWVDDKGGKHYGWEVERLRSLSKNVMPGDFVWDIGTELGDISALVQSWIGHGDGGMILFEPNPLSWPTIKTIWEANDLKGPIFCWVGFAGNENRGWTDSPVDMAHLCEWPPCAEGPITIETGFCQLNERPDIPSLRLDELSDWIGAPSIIMADVEGSELEVLRGSEDILVEHMPLLYISVHPEFMIQQYDTHPDELHRFLYKLGYRTQVLEIDHEVHVVAHHPHGRELRH